MSIPICQFNCGRKAKFKLRTGEFCCNPKKSECPMVSGSLKFVTKTKRVATNEKMRKEMRRPVPSSSQALAEQTHKQYLKSRGLV